MCLCMPGYPQSVWFGAQLLTDTLSLDSLSVAHVALAAIAALRRVGRGDAASVLAQVGEVFAHVDGVVHGDSACEHDEEGGQLTKHSMKT